MALFSRSWYKRDPVQPLCNILACFEQELRFKKNRIRSDCVHF